MRIHALGLSLLLLVPAGAVAQGLGGPPRLKQDLGSHLLELFPERAGLDLVNNTTDRWTPTPSSECLYTLLRDSPLDFEPNFREGTRRVAHLELRFDRSRLAVTRVDFGDAEVAMHAASFAFSTKEPVFLEVRGGSVLALSGSLLTQTNAGGLAQVRNKAWAVAPRQTAQPALSAFVMGEKKSVGIARGSSSILRAALQARDATRTKTADIQHFTPEWNLRWLDGSAQTALSMTMNTAHLELLAEENRASFALAGSWGEIEGAKAVLRRILSLELPPAPEGLDAKAWRQLHQSTSLADPLSHTTPVLLSTRSRPAESGPSADTGPTQDGLTKGVSQASPE